MTMVYTVVRFPNPHYIVTFKSVGESDLVLQLPRVAANDCDVFNYHSDGSSVSCLSLGNPEKLTFKWQSSFRVWYHLGSLSKSVLLWMIMIIMMILMIQDLDFDDSEEIHKILTTQGRGGGDGSLAWSHSPHHLSQGANNRGYLRDHHRQHPHHEDDVPGKFEHWAGFSQPCPSSDSCKAT